MRKHITIFLSVVVLMVTGLTFSYAAFPIANNVSTTVVANGNNDAASNEFIVQHQKNDSPGKIAKKLEGNSGKSQVVALILCILVGVLGIHRFYLGYTWQGVVQLLTAGGCGIWALIDLIRIITGDLQPKNGRYSEKL